MDDWKRVLKADPTDWLLEPDNPSVRYFTLTEILEWPEDSPDVRETRTEIMETGAVPKILAKQTGGGYWEAAENF